jgi:chromate transport protein ChrA
MKYYGFICKVAAVIWPPFNLMVIVFAVIANMSLIEYYKEVFEGIDMLCERIDDKIRNFFHKRKNVV